MQSPHSMQAHLARSPDVLAKVKSEYCDEDGSGLIQKH